MAAFVFISSLQNCFRARDCSHFDFAASAIRCIARTESS
jgi:hypothetical protein